MMSLKQPLERAAVVLHPHLVLRESCDHIVIILTGTTAPQTVVKMIFPAYNKN